MPQSVGPGTFTLADEARMYQDVEANHVDRMARFTAQVNATPWLNAHRTFAEEQLWGFGERYFQWMWKLLVDAMPPEFSFLEIGVYKGQIVSLIPLCAQQIGKTAHVTGVTPLSTTGGPNLPAYPPRDYLADILHICEVFGVPAPFIVHGDSTQPAIQQAAAARGPFDLVYIDGCHEQDFVVKDLTWYRELVKPGGYLIVDDASCHLKMPWGIFTGIEEVVQAVEQVLDPDPRFQHLFAVGHNRVWRRVG